MQRKKSARSASFLDQLKSEIRVPEEINIPPSDTLVVKIFSLRVSDEDPKHFAVKVTYFDQLLVHAIIKSIGARDEEATNSIANGTMNYDPSDYEKMCMFADSPLVVQIQPLRSIDPKPPTIVNTEENSPPLSATVQTSSISCCNVDILSIFLGLEDQQKMCIKKRLEPMVQPSMRHRKSWDTLPLLTMELTAERDPMNIVHHKVLNDANWMKLTIVASYNMYIPYENDYVYTAATKTPLYTDNNVGVVTYSQGYKEPSRFSCTSFYPKWETLRGVGDVFTKGDEKLHCQLEDIQNDDCIDLPYYLNRILPYHTAVWGSFHRTLLLEGDQWMWKHLRKYKWPVEVHIYGETGGYSFMAFLNLFNLLYPGETTLRLAVPLQWINAAYMLKECGCDLLLTPNDKTPSVFNDRLDKHTPPASIPRTNKSSKAVTESTTSTLTISQWRATGADGNDAFVVVEVQFGRPLKPIVKTPRILQDELSAMLTQMEVEETRKRICSGRGQLERDWQKTVRSAANSLRKVPYFGTTEFCTFNRQLSETRTRVELTTSFWQDAAIFINNNFVIQQYLHSDEVFEELIMMAHACLMRSASTTLMKAEHWHEDTSTDAMLRAARHARQMQDSHHALDLYLRLVVDKPQSADYWRELSTCLRDHDKDCANVCLDKSIMLDPRHPLTLLAKGTTLFEENPMAAEPFFIALLAFTPTWTTAWTIASVYFYERELFHVADVILKYAEKSCEERWAELIFPRTWEQEMGDWWDSTPLLPGMSLYYDAADFLLRLRAIPLAEACMARLLSVKPETGPYYHLVALCCRLRGEYEHALCHIGVGLGKFGEITYLRSLQAEIHHKLGNIKDAITSFKKAGSCISPFSILMSLACGDHQHARKTLLELVRRQASAYAWTTLADNWTKTEATIGEGDLRDETKKAAHKLSAKTSAIAFAIQALKVDRRAGRAWAVLAKLVEPSARRIHCLQMAKNCGWHVTPEDVKGAAVISPKSLCQGIGTALRECRCNMCDKTRL